MELEESEKVKSHGRGYFNGQSATEEAPLDRNQLDENVNINFSGCREFSDLGKG